MEVSKMQGRARGHKVECKTYCAHFYVYTYMYTALHLWATDLPNVQKPYNIETPHAWKRTQGRAQGVRAQGVLSI